MSFSTPIKSKKRKAPSAPSKPPKAAEPKPVCYGCETHQPNQMAHMGLNGCLGDDLFLPDDDDDDDDLGMDLEEVLRPLTPQHECQHCLNGLCFSHNVEHAMRAMGGSPGRFDGLVEM